jgi:4-hydroxy-tetrahydrodipicolinate synthase
MRVMMGVSGYKLDDTCSWARQLATLDAPPDALLLSSPHYIRPSQSGLRAWFEAVADSATCPIVIYDIPYRTCSTLDIDTLLSLAEHSMIQGIKDCGGDLTKTQRLIADGRLAVLAGEDANIFDTLASGGRGAIAASLHLAPRRTAQIAKLIAQGDLGSARALWEPLVPVFKALFDEPNPGPVKAVLAAQGLLANELRLPMTCASPELTEKLIALLGDLD